MTSFETFDYQFKRVHTEGTRVWKFWFSETPEGLNFRILTKDDAHDCYESVIGVAQEVEKDLIVKENQNEEAFFTDQFKYVSDEGSLNFFLEAEVRDLVWVEGSGAYAKGTCSFDLALPLMPEVAG